MRHPMSGGLKDILFTTLNRIILNNLQIQCSPYQNSNAPFFYRVKGETQLSYLSGMAIEFQIAKTILKNKKFEDSQFNFKIYLQAEIISYWHMVDILDWWNIIMSWEINYLWSTYFDMVSVWNRIVASDS